MSISIDGNEFEGPYVAADHLHNRQGVYVVLTNGSDENHWTVVDVGESGNVRERISSHDRSRCWQTNSNGKIAVAVLYTGGGTAAERRQIETRIRAQFNPACGII